jgi:NADH:ubiquinone oxidoreductase subunit K
MLILILFICLVALSIMYRKNLIFVLIILEMLGFVMIYFISSYYGYYVAQDYLVLLVFSILVMEGVIALCGLIMLVSFTGRDYLVSSSVIKL